MNDHARSRKDLPLTRLLPNMLTLLSLCSGLTAIRFALHDKWQEAVLAIVIAAVFDVLDGRVARLLNIAEQIRRRARQPVGRHQFWRGARAGDLRMDAQG